MPVLGEAGNTLHFLLIQNQQQKDVVGYFPFALDSMSAGGPEAKSGFAGFAFCENRYR